jgi:hypothetical protein
MGERERGVYRVLVGKPEGKRQLGKTRRRREDNIKIFILRMWDRGHGLECSGPGYGQLADSCGCDDEPSGSIKFGEFLD